MIDVAQALRDPKLLGAALGAPETWQTWMVVLKAAFGSALTDDERATFASIAGSREPPQYKVSQLWAIAGRGSGKSRIAAAVAVYIACFIEHTLAPGEVGNVLTLAASRDQANAVFSYAQAFLNRSPILRQQIESTTANEIRLKNSVVVSIHTNSFRLIRGRTLLAVIFDELAYWRDESSANPDLEVYRAVRPSLVRTGGMLIGISSPYRRAGLLHSKYKGHFAVDDPDVLVVKGTTTAFNPTISAATIAKEFAADPESARSEWGAEFRSDVSALFDDAVIEDAIQHARPLELPPRDSIKYHAFVDASAGRHDAFTVCVGHTEGKPPESLTWVCDAVRGRPAPFDPRATAWEFAQLARQYHCTKVVGDHFAGEWVAGAFKDAGLLYETSPLAKSSLYLEALPFFNRGAVRIPDVPVLLRELRGLERRVHRSGRDSVDHPSHGSDDYANVICGALNVATRGARRQEPQTNFIWFGQGEPPPWWNNKDREEREHSRVRIEHITEQEDLRRRGLI